MIVNRFVAIAEKYPYGSIPLDKVFEDAEQSESDEIVEAMYVIARRRQKAGSPLGIDELTNTVPFIIEEDTVRDAAIDISIQSLTASGYSYDRAVQAIMESTSSAVSQTSLAESEQINQVLLESITDIRRSVVELPCSFGSKGYDGQARYELRRILGSGNQGVVYEAIDTVFQEENLPSLVAVKVFHSDVDPEESKKEGARARRVRHKNVARVIDQGQAEDGQSYVTYELIEGQSLDAWVKQLPTPLTHRKACEIIIQLARGVQSAHAAGVIHRDLKPTNILMNRDDQPVITDFGISFAAASDPRLSSHYDTRGSLAFMAPEQYSDTSDGSIPSVDVYALGGVFYWLLTQRFPNGDTVNDALRWLELRNEGGPERFDDWNMDRRLKGIVCKALAMDPSARYQSSEMLAKDIEDYLDNRPIAWQMESVPQKMILFTKRNPVAVLLVLFLLLSISTGVGGVENARAGIRYERAQAASMLNIEQLNSQIEVEQERVRQVQDKAKLVRQIMVAWSDSVKTGENEKLTAANLFFLHLISSSGMLDDDPEYVEQVIKNRIKVAENYLATRELQNVSPIELAMWHEMLGLWYEDQDAMQSQNHYNIVSSLIAQYAPTDIVWRDRINDKLASLIK